ncbi:MAG: ROK family protein [Candidatus Puniceispirillaceae bacterium]
MISLVIDHDRIRAAIITDGGDFVSAKSIEAPVGGYRDWLVASRDLVSDIGAPASMAVAVAVPAIMDGDRATFSAVAPLSDSDLRRDLQSTLGRVVRCFGFGDCLAAWQTKTLEDAGTVMALWVGASCHGGVRANGRPLTGAHGAAGNWAHLQLPSPVPHELDGRPCWCGRSGCLETFLSTSGLEEDYERVTGEHHSASDIAAAAAAGDIVAESVIQVYEDRLGRATATMITLLDPNVIILGGAVPLADRMCERLPRKWPGYVQIDRSKTELHAVQEGTDALLGGAAVLMNTPLSG